MNDMEWSISRQIDSFGHRPLISSRLPNFNGTPSQNFVNPG